VNERDEYILLHLFDRQILHQVRTNSPVLLRRIQNLIVDPTAAWCLQQRMIEEEAEPTPGNKNPSDLYDRIIDIFDVLEHETGNDCVKGFIGEGKTIGRGSGNFYSAVSFRRDDDLIPSRVDADDEFRPQTHCEASNLPIAAADIENSLHPLEFGCSQRKYLLDVLGISSFGESFDPPGGMVLP
jgi:hypothetical protein